MALMNLKPLQKQKTLGPGRGATPGIGMSTFANKPSMGAPDPAGGLFKVKKPSAPKAAMPSLMKRLTGK